MSVCVPSECIAAGMYYVLCIYVAESVGTSLFAMLVSNKLRDGTDVCGGYLLYVTLPSVLSLL